LADANRGGGSKSTYFWYAEILAETRSDLSINQPTPGTPQRVIDCHAGYSTADPRLTPIGDGLQDIAADAPAAKAPVVTDR
jgi:hypothetical protein